MWFAASVNAFDAMDTVTVAAVVRARADDQSNEVVAVETFVATFPGTGETDTRRWLRDALVALAETL